MRMIITIMIIIMIIRTLLVITFPSLDTPRAGESCCHTGIVTIIIIIILIRQHKYEYQNQHEYEWQY